jgi:hypothetical protein
MEFKLINRNNIQIAELTSDTIVINNSQNALELINNSPADKIIIHKKNICEAFFDLKTRIAGETIQKFINYHAKAAIIGDFSNYTSKSFKDFIYETNKQGCVMFLESSEDAIKHFTS